MKSSLAVTVLALAAVFMGPDATVQATWLDAGFFSPSNLDFGVYKPEEFEITTERVCLGQDASEFYDTPVRQRNNLQCSCPPLKSSASLYGAFGRCEAKAPEDAAHCGSFTDPTAADGGEAGCTGGGSASSPSPPSPPPATCTFTSDAMAQSVAGYVSTTIYQEAYWDTQINRALPGRTEAQCTELNARVPTRFAGGQCYSHYKFSQWPANNGDVNGDGVFDWTAQQWFQSTQDPKEYMCRISDDDTAKWYGQHRIDSDYSPHGLNKPNKSVEPAYVTVPGYDISAEYAGTNNENMVKYKGVIFLTDTPCRDLPANTYGNPATLAGLHQLSRTKLAAGDNSEAADFCGTTDWSVANGNVHSYFAGNHDFQPDFRSRICNVATCDTQSRRSSSAAAKCEWNDMRTQDKCEGAGLGCKWIDNDRVSASCSALTQSSCAATAGCKWDPTTNPLESSCRQDTCPLGKVPVDRVVFSVRDYVEDLHSGSNQYRSAQEAGTDGMFTFSELDFGLESHNIRPGATQEPSDCSTLRGMLDAEAPPPGSAATDKGSATPFAGNGNGYRFGIDQDLNGPQRLPSAAYAGTDGVDYRKRYLRELKHFACLQKTQDECNSASQQCSWSSTDGACLLKSTNDCDSSWSSTCGTTVTANGTFTFSYPWKQRRQNTFDATAACFKIDGNKVKQTANVPGNDGTCSATGEFRSHSVAGNILRPLGKGYIDLTDGSRLKGVGMQREQLSWETTGVERIVANDGRKYYARTRVLRVTLKEFFGRSSLRTVNQGGGIVVLDPLSNYNGDHIQGGLHDDAFAPGCLSDEAGTSVLLQQTSSDSLSSGDDTFKYIGNLWSIATQVRPMGWAANDYSKVTKHSSGHRFEITLTRDGSGFAVQRLSTGQSLVALHRSRTTTMISHAAIDTLGSVASSAISESSTPVKLSDYWFMTQTNPFSTGSYVDAGFIDVHFKVATAGQVVLPHSINNLKFSHYNDDEPNASRTASCIYQLAMHPDDRPQSVATAIGEVYGGISGAGFISDNHKTLRVDRVVHTDNTAIDANGNAAGFNLEVHATLKFRIRVLVNQQCITAESSAGKYLREAQSFIGDYGQSPVSNTGMDKQRAALFNVRSFRLKSGLGASTIDELKAISTASAANSQPDTPGTQLEAKFASIAQIFDDDANVDKQITAAAVADTSISVPGPADNNAQIDLNKGNLAIYSHTPRVTRVQADTSLTLDVEKLTTTPISALRRNTVFKNVDKDIIDGVRAVTEDIVPTTTVSTHDIITMSTSVGTGNTDLPGLSGGKCEFDHKYAVACVFAAGSARGGAQRSTSRQMDSIDAPPTDLCGAINGGSVSGSVMILQNDAGYINQARFPNWFDSNGKRKAFVRDMTVHHHHLSQEDEAGILNYLNDHVLMHKQSSRKAVGSEARDPSNAAHVSFCSGLAGSDADNAEKDPGDKCKAVVNGSPPVKSTLSWSFHKGQRALDSTRVGSSALDFNGDGNGQQFSSIAATDYELRNPLTDKRMQVVTSTEGESGCESGIAFTLPSFVEYVNVNTKTGYNVYIEAGTLVKLNHDVETASRRSEQRLATSRNLLQATGTENTAASGQNTFKLQDVPALGDCALSAGGTALVSYVDNIWGCAAADISSDTDEKVEKNTVMLWTLIALASLVALTVLAIVGMQMRTLRYTWELNTMLSLPRGDGTVSRRASASSTTAAAPADSSGGATKRKGAGLM